MLHMHVVVFTTVIDVKYEQVVRAIHDNNSLYS